MTYSRANHNTSHIAAGAASSTAHSNHSLLVAPCDAAIHTDHIESMIAQLLGTDVMQRKPIGSIERIGTETFRITMMRSRYAEALRIAMHGGSLNGRVVSVVYDNASSY